MRTWCNRALHWRSCTTTAPSSKTIILPKVRRLDWCRVGRRASVRRATWTGSSRLFVGSCRPTPAFRLLYDEESCVLCHLSDADLACARHLIIELVLATDISRHFAILSHFNAKVRARHFDSGRAGGAGVSHQNATVRRVCSVRAQVNVGNLSLGRPEDMQLWLQMLLKCADVANPGKRCGIKGRA